MNTTLLAILPGLLVGTGLAVLLVAFAPRRVRADLALSRLGEAAVTIAAPATVLSRWDRIGSWTAQHTPQLKFLTPPLRDLDLLDISVSAFYARKVQYALGGFLLPLIIPIVFQILTGTPFLLPLALSPVLAAVFWFLPDRQVKSNARNSRREFTRFVGVYLQLVAVSLQGNKTADAALSDAASVSDTWVFRRIRQEYAAADLTNTSKWDALERLGTHLDVPALADLGRTMRLAEAKVGLREQLLAASSKLRVVVSSADRDAAERATASINVPGFLTLVPVLSLVMVPPVAAFFLSL